MAEQLEDKKCVPCDGGVNPMTSEQVSEYLAQIDDAWEQVDNLLIRRSFSFDDFKQTIAFVNKIADIAEQEQHHPDMRIEYDTLIVYLTTHAIKGLSENDFILAAKIDHISN